MSDKLNEINKQFEDLIQLIDRERTKEALKKWQIFEIFLSRRHPSFFRRNKIALISIGLIFLSICVFYLRSTEEFLYEIYFVCLALIRIAIVPLLPIWDWTKIYTSQCLIGNPFVNNSIDLAECNKCVNTSEVVRLSNITFFNFTKQIYFNHLPVIIDDATESWPAVRQLNLDRLFQMFAEDPILSQQDLCHFKSNIRQYNQIGGADRLFDDFLQGKRRSFVAHWSNCQRESLKIIRKFYSKPYFLPASIGQTLLGNWFIVSAGMDKTSDRPHQIPLNSEWNWVAQIQGRSAIRLEPQDACGKLCSTLSSIKLNTGDLIIYSRLFSASYLPLSKKTILLAQGFE